jgi:cytochrome b
MAHSVLRLIAVSVWDKPTRALPWLLALTIVVRVLNAKVGGNAMVWHSRFGHVVPTRYGLRRSWGMIGGRWSPFASFIHGSGKALRCLSGQSRADEPRVVDHSAPGGLSVFVLLGFLAVRVASLEAE